MKKPKIFGLIDANNFYASCEIAFNPKLKNKPVIVLSNNDGCVISRSSEAKKLGIKMGVPLFEIEDIVKKYNVYVFSSNFPLYADMSYRFHESLSLFFPDIEVYSVDECFIELTSLKKFPITEYAHYVKNQILQWLKIPSCIGIGKTKTLAKLANRYAKTHPVYLGVFNAIDQEEILLKNMPIEKVWGIGNKLARFLKMKGIETPYDFVQQNEYWIKKNLKIQGLRLLYELKGIPCYDLEEYNPEKKNTVVSRSFAIPITTLEELEEILYIFIEQLSKKLNQQKQYANYIMVFLRSNPFDKKEPYFSNSGTRKLEIPTNSIEILYKSAKGVLHSIYKEKIKYKKMGIMAIGLTSSTTRQLDIFENINTREMQKNNIILEFMERYNSSGKRKVTFAKNLMQKNIALKQFYLSKRYTIDIREIPIAYI